ncbi:MAG: hypothetical protein ACYDB1_05530 [Acidiferrobacteraceae bacterium]
MTVNPFDKTQFEGHRAWEECLVSFLVQEAKLPDVRNWLPLSGEIGAKRSAAFSALLLSSLLESKPGFAESSDKAYEIYNTLIEGDGNARKFEDWLRSGWLNISRIASSFAVALKQ